MLPLQFYLRQCLSVRSVRRYSKPCRTVLACTSLGAYVLSKLSVSVFSGAQIAEVVFGIP
eukprot:SAG22_NODE_15588_length_345_cov_0.821138_2_plen_59_part_01